jgi:tRNA-dihydrouridine synthase
MTIGNVAMPFGAALAPMAGVTGLPFACSGHEQGAAWTVTEMLKRKGDSCTPGAKCARSGI